VGAGCPAASRPRTGRGSGASSRRRTRPTPLLASSEQAGPRGGSPRPRRSPLNHRADSDVDPDPGEPRGYVSLADLHHRHASAVPGRRPVSPRAGHAARDGCEPIDGPTQALAHGGTQEQERPPSAWVEDRACHRLLTSRCQPAGRAERVTVRRRQDAATDPTWPRPTRQFPPGGGAACHLSFPTGSERRGARAQRTAARAPAATDPAAASGPVASGGRYPSLQRPDPRYDLRHPRPERRMLQARYTPSVPASRNPIAKMLPAHSSQPGG
jgi:hypothetical protein